MRLRFSDPGFAADVEEIIDISKPLDPSARHRYSIPVSSSLRNIEARSVWLLPDYISVDSAIRELEPGPEPRNRHRLPLRGEPRSALALALGRNAVEGDALGVFGSHFRRVYSSEIVVSRGYKLKAVAQSARK